MLQIADTRFSSRLLTGTGKFATAELMHAALQASGSQLVTLAMKRVDLKTGNDAIFAPLKQLGVKLLPNTQGQKPQMRLCSPHGWRAKRWARTG